MQNLSATMNAGASEESDDSPTTIGRNTLAVRKSKPARKNKPGMEVSAIRNSQSKTNMENGAMMSTRNSKPPAKIIRYRCGKDDHTLKQRPLPFQPKLEFAPSRPAA